jgi:hypothetical protein
MQRLDITLIAQLTRVFGRFPPGSLVRLNNNEMAVVTRRVPGAVFSPREVYSIADSRGQLLVSPRLRFIGYRECSIRNYANDEYLRYADYQWQRAWGYPT